MSEFKEKIKTLNDQFPGLIAEYRTNYYTDNKDQTKLTTYNMYNSKVAKCIRDMRDITLTLQAQNNEFVDIMSELNKLITIEQENNTKLKDKIENMKNVNNGSVTLVGDYKENYNETNMRNWALFLGIFAICVSFANIFIVPTYADSSLILKDRLDKAKAFVTQLQGVAKELNDKRIYYTEGEKRRKTDLDKQKIYERVKAEEDAKYAAQAARDAAREAANATKPK